MSGEIFLRSSFRLSTSTEILALFAQRLIAGARAKIFLLDVVTGVALRVVVVHRLLDRMPRWQFTHRFSLHLEVDLAMPCRCSPKLPVGHRTFNISLEGITTIYCGYNSPNHTILLT